MMKKLNIILLIVCCSFTAKSQFIQSVEYKAGVSVSAIDWHLLSTIMQSSLSNTYLFPDDYIGFSTAFNIKYLNHNYWNLSTQIGYTQIGGSEILQFTDVTGGFLTEKNIHERMDYINFNTLFEIKYPIRKFTTSFKFGPHLDYLASAFSYDETFNRFNYGLDVGGSINYSISKYLYLSADYNYFFYFNKIKTPSLEVTIRKNASVMLGIGYKF